MGRNLQFPEDLVIFTEEIFNGKLHFCAMKLNKKCMKDYDKNKESSYLRYQYVNNLHGWEMSKRFL